MKVYKLVCHDTPTNQLVSCSMQVSGLKTIYSDKFRSKQRRGNPPLLAFDSMESLLEFARIGILSMGVFQEAWEADGRISKHPIPFRASICGAPRIIRLIIKSLLEGKLPGTLPWPKGTVQCSSIKLTKKIYPNKAYDSAQLTIRFLERGKTWQASENSNTMIGSLQSPKENSSKQI